MTVTLTLAEAAAILDPPITERQLRAIVVTGLGWQPLGHRYTGRPGTPPAVYDATRLMLVWAKLADFNENSLR